MDGKKGDVSGLLKVLRTWPDGCIFNRLKLPVEYGDKWVMSDLVRRGFIVDLGDNLYQRTSRTYAKHKRKPSRKKTFIGTAGRILQKALKTGTLTGPSTFAKQRVITNPVRTTEIFEMRAGQNGEAPASLQEIANRFSISRQRVEQILKKNGAAGRVLGKDPNFLTSTEAAKYLRVSYRSIYDWAKRGDLPFYQKRVGANPNRFLFRKESLDDFQQKRMLLHRRTGSENRGLKPLVIKLLELGQPPQDVAKLSGVGITTIYTWKYSMPGRDKRVGVALGKILSTGEERGLIEKVTDVPNLATGE